MGEKTILRQRMVLALIGLIIVFAVLSVLAVVVALVRRLDDRWQDGERAAEAARWRSRRAWTTITLVLITAAVRTYLQGRFRIRRVKRLCPRRTEQPLVPPGPAGTDGLPPRAEAATCADPTVRAAGYRQEQMS